MASDYNESSRRRKDVRSGLGDETVIPAHKSKKDTKRWCRGKVGVEHDFGRSSTLLTWAGDTVHWDVCKTCGRKVLKFK